MVVKSNNATKCPIFREMNVMRAIILNWHHKISKKPVLDFLHQIWCGAVISVLDHWIPLHTKHTFHGHHFMIFCYLLYNSFLFEDWISSSFFCATTETVFNRLHPDFPSFCLVMRYNISLLMTSYCKEMNIKVWRKVERHYAMWLLSLDLCHGT